jgi:uncharacterized protein (DUF169 family)
MQREQENKKTVYLVEVEREWSGRSYYETIAAFSTKEAAEEYLEEEPTITENWGDNLVIEEMELKD